MTYYLLEATLNGCIRDYFFFSNNLLSLINGEAVLLYHNRKMKENELFRPLFF